MKKVYLAGPDVFERDAVAIMRQHSELATLHGFIPLSPLDCEADLSHPDASKLIYQSNVDKIRAADIVVANLNPFRGHEPDSGTVWEIGYAAALGKIVIGYLADATPMLLKIQNSANCRNEGSIVYDDQDKIIENFNHPLNLMIMHGINDLVEGSFETALQRAQKHA